jgi:hypothetical protein
MLKISVHDYKIKFALEVRETKYLLLLWGAAAALLRPTRELWVAAAAVALLRLARGLVLRRRLDAALLSGGGRR